MITASGTNNSSEVPVADMPKVAVSADTKGRLRVTKAQRRDILGALTQIGDSLPQFARRTGIKYSTLARWVHTSQPKRSGRPPRLQLLEAVVESPPVTEAGALLVLQLPGGVRVEVANEKQSTLAAKQVRALAQPC